MLVNGRKSAPNDDSQGQPARHFQVEPPVFGGDIIGCQFRHDGFFLVSVARNFRITAGLNRCGLNIRAFLIALCTTLPRQPSLLKLRVPRLNGT